LANSSIWIRPRNLGYHESLRGLGGIVSPLLAGFALAAIATIVTTDSEPLLAEWAVAAFAIAIVLLLHSMQVAFQSLMSNSSPGEVLMWRPEASVSTAELQSARAAQAADFAEMARLARRSFRAYGVGVLAFLAGVLLLMVPRDWSVAVGLGIAAVAIGLVVEIWWLAANRWKRLPHPVGRRTGPDHESSWDGSPPELSPDQLKAVMGDPGPS
jgi:hypothetical protein